MPRPPPRSTLFPYTTLFRSLQLQVPQWSVLWMEARRRRAAEPVRGDALLLLGRLYDTGRHAPKPRAHLAEDVEDRKSTRLNSSHSQISYAVFCLKKKTKTKR